MLNGFRSKNDTIIAISNMGCHENPVKIRPNRNNFQSSYCRSNEIVGPRLIAIAVKILQIGDLKPKLSTFFAEIELYLDWIPTTTEVLNYIEGRDMNFDPPEAIKLKNGVALD